MRDVISFASNAVASVCAVICVLWLLFGVDPAALSLLLPIAVLALLGKFAREGETLQVEKSKFESAKYVLKNLVNQNDLDEFLRNRAQEVADIDIKLARELQTLGSADWKQREKLISEAETRKKQAEHEFSVLAQHLGTCEYKAKNDWRTYLEPKEKPSVDHPTPPEMSVEEKALLATV